MMHLIKQKSKPDNIVRERNRAKQDGNSSSCKFLVDERVEIVRVYFTRTIGIREVLLPQTLVEYKSPGEIPVKPSFVALEEV